MNGLSKAGVGQDPMLDLVNTRDYTVQYNDSPASIAKQFGITLSDLLAANPQKPTKVVAGVQTFRELMIGETLSIPTVGLSGVNGVGVGFNFFKAALLPWGAITEAAKALKHGGVAVRHGRPRSDQTWERWQQIHPGTPYSDYQNWWNQYGGQGGGTIGYAGTGVGQADQMPSVSDVVGQGYVQTNQDCFAGQFCYVLTQQSPAGPLTRTYTFSSNDPTSRANGTGTNTPAGQPEILPAWPNWMQFGINGRTGVGQSAQSAVDALSQTDPCDPANVGLVWAAQQAIGLDPDGKWGDGSMKAAQAKGILHAPYGCSPRPTWWAPAGQKNFPSGGGGAAPVPAPIPTPDSSATAPSSSVPALAQAALAAINADPNYCTSVGQPGSAVNSAVHAFKAAWNADNPSMPVPIGTGRYESATANALSLALGRQPAPPACGAAAPAPMRPDSAPIPGPGGPGGGGGPGGPGGSTSVVVQPGGGGTYPLPAPKKPGISTGAIVAGAIGVAALVGIVAIAATSGKKTQTRYRTRKGKTKYITRKAPKRRKHNRSAHKKR